ncbi:MAG: ATP-grasp fold amidoligase family protein [Rikenellaceae bacterium]
MAGVITYINRPKVLMVSMLKRFKHVIPDKAFVRAEYRLKMGRWPDLKNPTLLSEKIQWLKLFDHNTQYVPLVDKVEAKKHVSKIIGEEHIIPTIGVWRKAREIDFDALPEQFVLKCNHRGGGVVFICRDKATFNFKRAKRKLRRQLRKSMYSSTKEWPYKNVRRRIICEQYMVDESGCELKDYKFYCFNGEPKFCQLVSNRYAESETCKDIYDAEWRLQEFSGPFNAGDTPVNRAEPLPRPENYSQMLEIAAKLSKGMPFARIDLYNINGVIYFGEITLYPASGMRQFYPLEWNKRIGDWVTLPKK